MTPVVLFDWGDTLMRDMPGVPGKMCDWPEVEAMPGAVEALASLCRFARLYVASGATGSTAEDIRMALGRVGLDRYVSGGFCRQNTGFQKPDPRFYRAVLRTLGARPEEVTMVGDSLEKDILPCHGLGLQTILLAAAMPPGLPSGIGVIASLKELRLQCGRGNDAP